MGIEIWIHVHLRIERFSHLMGRENDVTPRLDPYNVTHQNVVGRVLYCTSRSVNITNEFTV